jgi:arsenite-transporting ATPase
LAPAHGNGEIAPGWFSMLLGTGSEKQKESSDVKEHTGERIAFFGGKGGVGKTTCSAAYALALAEKGRRTLLVSTDPAHSLGDLLNVRTGDEACQVRDFLYVREIDPERASRRYLEEAKENMRGLAAPRLWNEVERQMDFAAASPGADEAALFDEMVSVILEAEGAYDRIVFDTAPTGHTLRLLSLPELMGVWIEGMLARRRKTRELRKMLHNASGLADDDQPEDRVYALLQRRKNRFASARKRLLDPSFTSFYFVVNPERLSILEAFKARNLLNKYGIPVGGVVVNRVIPEQADGAFLAQRREQEKVHLQEVEKRFGDLPLLHIPLEPKDIQGMEGIRAVSERFRRENFGGI